MTILAHMQGKNTDHYSTGLCIKKFNVIIMWICHAVKMTTMWFCGGGGAHVMYESNCHWTYALGCAAHWSRNADYRLLYHASKLVTLANWKWKESFCSVCLNKECWIETVFQCLGLSGLSALHVRRFLHLKHQIICTNISVLFCQQLKLPIFGFATF
jgi:hypothetical protein